MTDTITTPDSPATPAPAEWASAFQALKDRYPKVREPILVALHILTQDPDIGLDDAKAQAQMHGTRITAASVAGAKRLLSRQGEAQENASAAKDKEPAAARTRRARRPQAKTSKATDPEALIREVAEKIRSQGDAEAERLRAAMRKAIAVMQAAVHA